MVTSVLNNKDPYKDMTLLRAIRWIIDCWTHNVSKETIANCFLHSQLLRHREEVGNRLLNRDQDRAERDEVMRLAAELVRSN